MLLKADTDTLVITSEDPMDAEYLESFFGSPVKLRMDSTFKRCGFHKTDKQEVQVTLTKAGEGK